MNIFSIRKELESLIKDRTSLVLEGADTSELNRKINSLQNKYNSLLLEDTLAGKSVKDINFIIDEKEKEYSSYLVEDTQSTNIDVGKDIPTSISNELNRVLSFDNFKKFLKK